MRSVYHRRGGLGGGDLTAHRASPSADGGGGGGLLAAADAGHAGVGLQEGPPELGAPDLLFTLIIKICTSECLNTD